MPETSGIFPPIRPAIIHKIIAPQTPALAPKPVATPNASACGSATIAEFKLPKKSPARIFKRVFIMC